MQKKIAPVGLEAKRIKGHAYFLDEIGKSTLAPSGQTFWQLCQKIRWSDSSRSYPTCGSQYQIDLCDQYSDSQHAVYENTFRQDLLYSDKHIDVQLPPLRERVEDIPTLGQDHFHCLLIPKNTTQRHNEKPPSLWSKRMSKYQLACETQESFSIVLSEQSLWTNHSVLQPEDLFLPKNFRIKKIQRIRSIWNILNTRILERIFNFAKALQKHQWAHH